jgi:hypothetical protein
MGGDRVGGVSRCACCWCLLLVGYFFRKKKLGRKKVMTWSRWLNDDSFNKRQWIDTFSTIPDGWVLLLLGLCPECVLKECDSRLLQEIVAGCPS